ncbi:factor of DNA methylation 1-like [Salvia hispanica]|uniref:factor of DNA methylation 1-like n=1 Tax=Salvia hispanica TaxID=49212 RepID=UPI0020093BFD|nr:factor of DNA methylation 1-like [Salvia hispanica]
MGEEDISEMKEMLYKGFKAGNEKVKASDGKFACPYCACKDQDYDYVSLLQHAIRVSEGSLSLHQRARHSAMATYLAIDISYQSPEKYSDDEWVPPKPTKRSRTQVTKKNNSKGKAAAHAKDVARAEQSEKEAAELKKKLDETTAKTARRQQRAKETRAKLERKMDETREEMNVLITKERASNDELQGVRKELIKGFRESSSRGHIGLKTIGELDHDAFINHLVMRMPPGDNVIRGVELCTEWEEKIKDVHWHPFNISEDANGKPQRSINEEDRVLVSLKEEFGEEIHDMVVDAVTEIHDHTFSGSCELWNFQDKRKASLVEVVHSLFKLPAAKRTSKQRKQTKGA